MKFYRVRFVDMLGVDHGAIFTTTHVKALAAAKRFHAKQDGAMFKARSAIEEVEVSATKAGILAALERYATYPAKVK